jgi:acetyltransferase-like isoleucine patch superfamily enzyme
VLIEKPRIPIREVILFGLWPSFVKVWLYRLRGYKIGKGVSLGIGAVLSGDSVFVGDHTSIGMLTIIRGKEICIGAHVTIGSMTFLDTPFLEIGEGSRINEQVFVGGLQAHDSRFVMGRNCQIMQMSFINPARSITMGDDSGIGGHCLLFGHASWLSQFEGYDVDFQPIEIGKSVAIAWRVFILPGSKIGDGSVIGANSLVQGTIPPQSMAVGYPARVVAKAPSFPKTLTPEDKEQIFRNIVAEMIGYFSGSGLQCQQEGERYIIHAASKSWWGGSATSMSLQTTESEANLESVDRLPVTDVFLSLREIPTAVRERLTSRSIMWIDVTKKEQSRTPNNLGDEVSLYLKRFGVRTLRWPHTPPERRGK